MIAEITAAAVLLVISLAEWLHSRRCKQLALLAFGPTGKPRQWTALVPFLRVSAVAILTWSLVTLLLIDPKVLKPNQIPEGGFRHIVIAYDASPSMQIRDAGPAGQQTRAQRAGELLMSVLERSVLEQVRVSIVAFYTGAKPVVVDTYDLEVVKNILNDLPLDVAFDPGKTRLLDGIKEAVDLTKSWKEKSTTLIVVSDGDTVPDTGMPALPAALAQTLVIGVGDSRAGKFIDGHQSRQDVSGLRQVATRLRGVYHDGNEKHLPSQQLAALSTAVPMHGDTKTGRRELALAGVVLGALVLSSLPVALAFAGSSWQAGRKQAKVAPSDIASPDLNQEDRAVPEPVSKPEMKKEKIYA